MLCNTIINPIAIILGKMGVEIWFVTLIVFQKITIHMLEKCDNLIFQKQYFPHTMLLKEPIFRLLKVWLPTHFVKMGQILEWCHEHAFLILYHCMERENHDLGGWEAWKMHQKWHYPASSSTTDHHPLTLYGSYSILCCMLH